MESLAVVEIEGDRIQMVEETKPSADDQRVMEAFLTQVSSPRSPKDCRPTVAGRVLRDDAPGLEPNGPHDCHC